MEGMTRRAFSERAAWVIAAAAAALLIAELGSRRRTMHDIAAATRDRAECVAELEAVRAEGEAQRVALAIVGSQSASIIVFTPQWGAPETVKAILDLPQQRGMILSSGLNPRAGRDYQLWILRGQAPPRPAGLLRPQASGALLEAIDPALLVIPPDGLLISLEPQGGSTTGRPSADVVFIANVTRS